MASCGKLRLTVLGAVQGVGFRPFVYRLARRLNLDGWVLNDGRGVVIEVEGERSVLEDFRERLETELPPRAIVTRTVTEWADAEGLEEFSIRESAGGEQPTTLILPDVATCDECLGEVVAPENRRFRYPFTNCTNCGPRFSIIEGLPYDRPRTTMRDFAMCALCRTEYEAPLDRRFHAQPNACPACGPQLELLDRHGRSFARADEALTAAADRLRRGEIVALKGLGGFLLLVDASDDTAVRRLRRRKRREEKPLALMVGNLEAARSLCRVEALEAELLSSPEAPIVLLERLDTAGVAPAVAPHNPYLGVMLPYTPLHHLLARGFCGPLVATSGNRSDEPIAIDNQEARERLSDIADWFLVHDRPIARHVDDSVLRPIAGEAQPLRRARGYAPLPVMLRRAVPTMLAVGGQLKNVAALSIGESVFLSQHIGDMETPQAIASFERVIVDFLEMYEAEPEQVVRDLHPDYLSSRWAEQVVTADTPLAGPGRRLRGLPLVAVQHHHAHLASCLAEHRRRGQALGVTWDGTGYGTDGTVWGGEFLVGSARGYRRLATLRPFRLPGGDAAVKEPRRVALALAWELWESAACDRADRLAASFRPAELGPLERMLATGFRSPLATSVGRLFDGVAALAGLRQRVAYEGQAAMLLEFAVDRHCGDAYPLPLTEGRQWDGSTVDEPRFELDWRPLIEAVVEDSRRGERVGIIASRFHNALVEGVVRVARAADQPVVVLTGGCFQNRVLSERVSEKLVAAHFEVLRHRLVPANDGGLSLGQIAVAAAQRGQESG